MRDQHEEQEYNAEERNVFERNTIFFHDVKDSQELKLASSLDNLVHLMTFDHDNAISGIIMTIIDAPLEDAAAYDYLKASRERSHMHNTNFEIEKFTRRISDHSQYYVESGLGEFRQVITWRREGASKIVISSEDTNDLDDEIPLKGEVQVSLRMHCVLERLPSTLDVAQTRVTCAFRLPRFGLDIQATIAMEYSRMRKKFDKSRKLDAVRRANLLPQIELMPVGGAMARDLEVKFRELFEEREGSEVAKTLFGSSEFRCDLRRIKSSQAGFLTNKCYAPLSPRFTCRRLKARRLTSESWGHVSVPVRGNLEEVAAFLWQYDSRAYFGLNSEDVERTFLGSKLTDVFEATIERRQKVTSKHFRHLSDRVFNSKMKMAKIDNNTIVLFSHPLKSESNEETVLRSKFSLSKKFVVRSSSSSLKKLRISLGHGMAEVVEGRELKAVRLTKVKEGHVQLSMAIELFLDGFLSKEAKLDSVRHRLEEAAKISIYFQRLHGLDEITFEDGEAIANDLLFNTQGGTQRVERLPKVLEENVALAELTNQYDSFEPIMNRFLIGSLRLSRPIKTKLSCLSEREVRVLD